MATKKRDGFAGLPAFRRLKKHLRAEDSERSPIWEYELGQLVDALCPSHERAYGENRIDKLKKDLGGGTTLRNRLWNARNFFKKQERKDVSRLMTEASKRGYTLGVTHMMVITSVDEPDAREQVAKDCIAGKWSLRRLRRTVQELRGKRSAGGASLVRPASVEEALPQITEKSRDWLKRYKEVWFQQEDAVFSDDLTRKSARDASDQLQEAKDAVDELRKSVTVAAKYLDEQLRRVQKPKTTSRKSNRGSN